MPWGRFIAAHPIPRRPREGEHVTLIGRTGRGKTTLAARGLLPRYPYVLYLATKQYDRSAYPYLEAHGFQMTDNPRLDSRRHPKVIYRPGPFGVSEADKKLAGERMALVLDVAYRQRGWAIYADELGFLVDQKVARVALEHIWRTGRGLERKVDGRKVPAPITLIASTVNPVDIPRVALDQITHLFIWRQTEQQRAERIAEIAGREKRELIPILMSLPEYEALYLNTDTGAMVLTQGPQ